MGRNDRSRQGGPWMNEDQYIPEKGDVVWIDFDPAAGQEIKKRRAGVVVSRYEFNRATWFAVICPITSTINKMPVRFTLPDENKINGQVLVQQLKSLDFKARNIQFVEKLSEVDNKKIDQIIEYIF